MIISRLKKIPENFRRAGRVADIVSPKTGLSRRYVMWDFIRSYFKYGSNEEDYIGLEFYKKSESEKNRFTTFKRNYHNILRYHYKREDITILDNKDLFNEKFKDFINRKWISTKNSNADQIRKFINKLGDVIVKPLSGIGGKGVYKLKSSNVAKIEEFLSDVTKGKHYIVEELIKQHPDMAYFNESSVNTCRIETVMDKNGNVQLINTIVIIGGVGSDVSNTHNGGVMVHVDPESGIVDSKGRNPEGKFYLHHPGNGVLLIGKKIPYWKEVLDYAKKLHKNIPNAPYIGWDIAITEDGPTVIEGNSDLGHCTQACDMVGRWDQIKTYLGI